MTRFDRITVVVGGAVELGRACSLRAGGPNTFVMVVDEDENRVNRTVADLEARNGTAVGITARLDDLDSMRALSTRLPDELERVDTVVNCQFATDKSSVRSVDVRIWERVVRTNLTAPLVIAQTFESMLRASANASIVNVGSIDGVMGNPWLPAYSSSKGGLIALTHVMASEFGAVGIRVNYVARCGTKEMKPLLEAAPGAALRSDWEEQLAASTPLRRVGSADETAAVIDFLASAGASFVNGAVLTVDGGRTAVTPATV